MMTEVFPVVAEKPKLTVVSKKKVDVKGFEFLRKTGYVKAAGLPDMYYTAYPRFCNRPSPAFILIKESIR